MEGKYRMISSKTTGELVKDNLVSIGVKGTMIRGLSFLASRYNEQRVLRKYCEKHIKASMVSSQKPVRKVRSELNCQNTIWVCWFQGIENAPMLIQKCYKSLRDKNRDHDIRVITEDNIGEYVEFPDHIKKKYEMGLIKKPHFSDILRAALLYCYGGIWVDSTMLFTDRIPEYIWDSDMFVFKFTPQESKYQVASSQFIRAKAGNEILRKTLVGLFDYWKKKNKLISYYLFHYVFALAVSTDLELKKQFNNIPLILSADNHKLQWRLFELYSPEEWESITRCTFVHKLSYKHLGGIDKSGTFYKYIIENI